MKSDTKRDRTRGKAAKLATLNRKGARAGKRAGQFITFATPAAFELGAAA